MQVINATNLDYKALNEALRGDDRNFIIQGCCGQRFIAAGMSEKNLTINGIPGNSLGAYLNNAQITVNANTQDAVGDTMNEGKILIYGNIGDAAGYAMRGGKIYVKGNAGYRPHQEQLLHCLHRLHIFQKSEELSPVLELTMSGMRLQSARLRYQ